MHNGELRNLYLSPNIIRQIKSRRLRGAGHSEDQDVDGIKMDLREIGWEGVEWTHLAEDGDWWWAVVNMVMNHWVLAPQS
jgi:hypothetical protein